jgi:RNA-splicing ligase RtcB
MVEIHGTHNTAKVYTDAVDAASCEQIIKLCNQPFSEGSAIRLMPDVHAGAGCTIGTTMTIKDKVVPNLVGVDIGCGMETLVIPAGRAAAQGFDPVKLDAVIHAGIPCGREIRDDAHAFSGKIDFDRIRCPAINRSRAERSIGSLGGGNHFIEADRDDEGNLYLVIHSGSRHLGQEIANYYQEEAWKQLNQKRSIKSGAGSSPAPSERGYCEGSKAVAFKPSIDLGAVIERLKAEGRQKEIQERIKEIRGQIIVDVPEDLAYASGDLFDDYINDMKIVQLFAAFNRKAMLDVILTNLGIAQDEGFAQFSTIHNYIDTGAMILRKGAVSAKAGEKLIVPINMRDGSLICEGLGNPDWNYSAPHGAGRIMSRRKALSALTLEEFEKSMEGIYSTSIAKETLDESPMAYKKIDEIMANITPTAKILKIVKPVYNFKATE